jgi:Tfp pilus assembly protein PilV
MDFILEELRMNKNHSNNHSSPYSCPGFTLIETLVSLILVFMGVLFVTQTISFSMDYYKKSQLRLQVQQKLQSESHLLASKPFEAHELNQGEYSKDDDPFKITWNVCELTPTIKKITLTVTHKQFSRKICLFKSKYLFGI